MIDLNDELQRTTEGLRSIRESIKVLEEDDIIKRYISLKKDEEILIKEQRRLYRITKFAEYEKCSHILVYTKVTQDQRGRIKKCSGCIKCGLEDRDTHNVSGKISFKEQVKLDFLKEKSPFGIQGKQTDIECSLSLALSIYSRIKEIHPDIDDKTALKYFEIALDNIRSIPVSEDRKVQRAKRLSLPSRFNKWYPEDIHEEKND